MSLKFRAFSGLLIGLLVAAPLAGCDQETLNQIDNALSTAAAESTLTAAAAPDQPTAAPATRTPRARATKTPAGQAAATAQPAPAAAGAGTWTVMMYEDADDEVLEEDIFIDVNEAERVGSTDQVKIVAQLDRYKGAFGGDGNWTGARRFLLQQDDDLSHIASPVADNLGEVNMADGQTLTDFIDWAVSHYPADHYALILSDHGAGWPGGWSDQSAKGNGPDKLAIAEGFGDMLYLPELDRALKQAVADTGIGRLDVIGLDACLMAQAEVFSALQPYAHYAVASEETEPGLGWAYTGFLGALVKKPSMDGAALSKAIVENYIVNDQRIVDDQARQDYAGRSVSASAAAKETAAAATLSAVDLDQMPKVLKALDDFAVALGEVDAKSVARARRYAQSFESVFGENIPPSYIDLANFAALAAKESKSDTVAQAAQALTAALKPAILKTMRGPERPGASGMAIFFPNSALFKDASSGQAAYIEVVQRFADESLWDDFLAAYYTGHTLSRAITAPTPVPAAEVVAPGAGQITVAPIKLSAKTATADKPVTLSTQVTGENVGFIYLFVGYYDETRNALKFADQDFVEGDGTREVDGVAYPTWDGPPISIDFTWEPTLFAINDGTRTVPALLNPEDYGAQAADTTYSTEGHYLFAGGERRYAKVFFDGAGNLTAIYGFANEDGSGALAEITPEAGDSFVMLDTWYDLKTETYASRDGETLTFSGTPWTWEAIPAPAGTYNLGFIAEDLDGNYSEAYVDVNVK